MDSVVLHRCKTPTDRLCACGRVARELARRGIEPTVERVPWRRAGREGLRALTGQAVAPVLVIDGEAICDSRRIVEHLAWRDDRCPLTESAGDERQRASSVHPGAAPRR